MNSYIILLRGINVGGNNKLSMKELTPLLVDCGFEDVQTYIQTGNIVLSAPSDPKEQITNLIEQHFGFKPKVLVLREKAFMQAVTDNPYSEFEGKTVHFSFCEDLPEPDLEKLSELAIESERFELINKVFYLHAPDGIGRSKLVAKVEKLLGVATTARNLNTVNKLVAMLEKS